MLTKAKAKTSLDSSDAESLVFRKEIQGLLLIGLALFYYICVFSYDPTDPSFFTSVTHSDISNAGGLIGSYLAGSLFFAIGASSYFLGTYFFINALLILIGKRERLRVLDFLVFLTCSVCLSVFLDLQVETLRFEAHEISAGGTLGRILGQVGQAYLGFLGIYLVVSFGALLTFLLATRLSFIDVMSHSGIVLGKGLGSFWGQLSVGAKRAKITLASAFRKLFTRTPKVEPAVSAPQAAATPDQVEAPKRKRSWKTF